MIKHTRVLAAAIIGVAALGTMAGCSGASGEVESDAGASECEVRSLIIGSMTGPNSESSKGSLIGSQAAVETINAAGGINGCDVILDVVDDGGDPTQTLPLAQAKMQEHEYAHVNVTGFGGASVQPYLIAEEQFAITNMAVQGAYADPAAKYQFDTLNAVADSDVVVAKQAIADGGNKLGIVVDNTALGSSIIDPVTAAVVAAGGEVVVVEQVDLAAVDYAPVVQRLKAAGADVVFFDLYDAAVGYMIRDVRAAQWDVPLYAGQIAYVTDLESLMDEEEYAGVIMGGSAGVSAPSSEATQEVIDQVVAAGDDSIRLHLGGVLWGHDSMTLFAWAANNVGSTDRAAMSEFLEKNGDTPVPGLTMAIATGYSADNHDWKGKDSIAIVKATARDDVGRYTERIGLFSPPVG